MFAPIWRDRAWFETRFRLTSGRLILMYAGKLNSGKEITYADGLIIDKYRGLNTVWHNGGDAAYRTNILRSVSDILILEIQKTFDFFRATATGENIQRIYIAGGTARVPGLVDLLVRARFRFSKRIVSEVEKKQMVHSVLPFFFGFRIAADPEWTLLGVPR